MKNVSFPYGKELITYNFENENFNGVLVSKLHGYKPEASGIELVKNAMANPISSKRLSELAKEKKNIVIIASDHTRPVPSKVIIPRSLRRSGAQIPKQILPF